MNLSDLPTFTPSSFPPSAFNYERPRHFIQSQPCFQAPSYDSVVKDTQENQNQLNLNSPQNSLPAMEGQMTNQSVCQTQQQFQYLSLSQKQSSEENQADGTSKPFSSSISTLSAAAPLPSAASPPPSSTVPRPTMRSSFTLTPLSPSAPSVPCAPLSFSISSGLGSATLPANQDPVSAPSSYHVPALPTQAALSPFVLPTSNLCSQLPLSSPPTSIRASPVSPSCPSVPQSSSQKQIPPAVISLPTSYKAPPHTWVHAEVT